MAVMTAFFQKVVVVNEERLLYTCGKRIIVDNLTCIKGGPEPSNRGEVLQQAPAAGSPVLPDRQLDWTCVTGSSTLYKHVLDGSTSGLFLRDRYKARLDDLPQVCQGPQTAELGRW